MTLVQINAIANWYQP